ncbi:MAG: glycogen debranching protein [Actinobacteria bacterium 13_2_20CM_2_71_6]|nr:MAG: glycogen debranching protein [Actinobacteria bacterium 13_2_20CM_2_71_6]
MSESSRLADRRFVVTGDHFSEVGAADATYPATGWHIRGEMGGFWTPPIKLLDGLWFAADGQWLKATNFTSGPGYVQMDLAGRNGLRVRRVDVAPDGGRAALVGLTFSGAPRRVALTVDAHSELMSAYPWGWTNPNQAAFNLPDRAGFDGRNLVFRETGTPPVPGAPAHDWGALVGSSLTPDGHRFGPAMRGPQDPAVVCPATDPVPPRCDDGPFGKGTGGELTYSLDLARGGRTVWFAVAGSDHGIGPAYAELRHALRDPAGALSRKQAVRAAVASRTRVDLPGDPLLARSVEWSKQNLADSVQTARDLRVFASHEGKDYPPPAGTVPAVRWIGAGWPDYPWLFATDGEYTAFAAVAAGQFDAIKDHLRALRDVSEIANAHSGKVVHEVTPDGQVYFGTNADPGNTDESAKFPSAVALIWRWTGDNRFRDDMYDFTVRTMRYVVGLDADRDGWPEGSGNVERPGMGPEKLDVSVYTIRGLRDLADLAGSRGDQATAAWAGSQATMRERAFEQAWWYPGDANSYADSLADPGNVQLFQRHWIGLTPMEASLPGGPLASTDHANIALAQRERDCYNGTFGLFHTGTGPTSASPGNKGPSCDSVLSAVQSDRETFSLNTAVMAVAEGNYGRLGPQRFYTNGNARIQLDPSVWELPGAMPEIAPSPDFPANIDHDFLSRSSVLQAWGTYGVLWPVVHQQLGVDPDLGHGRLAVVPQIPAGQHRIAGADIVLGGGAVDVSATDSGRTVRVEVDARLSVALTIGAVLPPSAAIADVRLDGHHAGYRVVRTARGTEVLLDAGTGGRHVLVVEMR